MQNNKITRVLVIGHSNRLGGVETFIYNTTLHLNPRKVQYDFLIHGSDNCVFQQEISDYYGDRNHFIFISQFKKRPFNTFFSLMKFYIKNKKTYSYIHLQTGMASEILYCFPFCLFLQSKVIVHSHNGSGKKIEHYLFRPIVNMVASYRLACSDLAAEWMFGKKYREKTRIIYNGIQTEKYRFNIEERKQIRNQYGIADNQFVVGHVGRFAETKNHKMILEIFSQIKCLRKDAVLMLVGEGELLDAVKEKVRQMDVEDSVIFVGRSDKTQSYYKAFDVFLMPSLYEGLPIVAVEAQASGLMCYLSNTISRQTKLTDAVVFLSLSRESKQWASIICQNQIKLADRESYADKVRNAGYDVEASAEKLEEIYLSGQ